MERKFFLISYDIVEQFLILITLLPCLDEFIWCTWDSVFEPRLSLTLARRCKRSEEIGSCLALRAVEPHIHEEPLSVLSAAEINLSTLIKNSNFVEILLDVSYAALRRKGQVLYIIRAL